MSPLATTQELRVAFLRVAKATHPDATVGLAAGERVIAERRFREAQRAYELLSDPDRRLLYDELLLGGFDSDPTHPTDRDGPQTGQERGPSVAFETDDAGAANVKCEICGSEPAAPLVLKRNVGLFVARRSYTLDAVLCAACAQSATRSFQVESLTKGWFGVVSVPVNLWNLAANSARSSSHRQQTSARDRFSERRVEPGWYPDPIGKHALRYYNAAGRWERLCRDEAGREIRDFESELWGYGPPGSPRPPDPPPRAERVPGAGRNGAGWYPDPSAKFALRYFNAGGKWERLCKTAEGTEIRDFDSDPGRFPPPVGPST